MANDRPDLLAAARAHHRALTDTYREHRAAGAAGSLYWRTAVLRSLCCGLPPSE